MLLKWITGNKYKLMAIIVGGYLLTDGLLNKGQLRVMFPKDFPEASLAVVRPDTVISLNHTGKEWVKAVNTVSLLKALPAGTAGIECDVYYENARSGFYVHHDPGIASQLNLDEWLSIYRERGLRSGIWLDLKNLRDSTHEKAFAELNRLRAKYGLAGKVLVESNHPELLQFFRNSGFYTAYYTPNFNPYAVSDDSLQKMAVRISTTLQRYPVNALTGYYFQHPFLHHYFPSYPVLTWSPKRRFSLVNWWFRRTVRADRSILITLYN